MRHKILLINLLNTYVSAINYLTQEALRFALMSLQLKCVNIILKFYQYANSRIVVTETWH